MAGVGLDEGVLDALGLQEVGWRWAGMLCAKPGLGGERDELPTRRHAASETAVGTAAMLRAALREQLFEHVGDGHGADGPALVVDTLGDASDSVVSADVSESGGWRDCRATPASHDEQRSSGDELHPRAFPPQCDRQRGADAVVVRVEKRID